MNQAEKQFTFDLQIFADEADAPAQEVEEIASSEEAAAPAEADSKPEKHISEMTDEEQTEYIKRHFLGDDMGGEPPKTPPRSEGAPQQEPGQGATQPEPPKEQEPTFEITVNGEKKQVTQSELISLAQKGEDYTRKTQALAEQRRQFEAQVQQFQQQQPRPQQPQPPQVKPDERMKAEYGQAVAIAEQSLGIKPGEFNMFDPVHSYALQQVIIRANMAAGRQMSERQAVENEVREFASQIQKDPMTKDISDSYEEYILRRGLESREGAQAAQAVAMAYSRFNQGNATRQDCKVLKEHWEYVRGQLNKAKAPAPPVPPKPQIKPPQTEAPGVGRSAHEGGGVLDTRKLRGLANDPDRQMAYMKSLGIFND